MAQNDKIWVGPGVLRAVPSFKGEKVVLPGHAIPKGFVSSDRIKQLEKRDKVCSESAYTKSQAASGVVPVANAAGKIKGLEAEVKQLEKANKELTEGAGLSVDGAEKIKELEANVEGLEKANVALTEGAALSAEEADNKIEGFEIRIGEFEAEIVELNKALKDTKKGDK